MYETFRIHYESPLLNDESESIVVLPLALAGRGSIAGMKSVRRGCLLGWGWGGVYPSSSSSSLHAAPVAKKQKGEIFDGERLLEVDGKLGVCVCVWVCVCVHAGIVYGFCTAYEQG